MAVICMNSIHCSCTCCPVWKTRVLAARTITSMVTEQNAPSLLGELYDKMDLTNQNSLHGLLLIVEMIVSGDKSRLLWKSSCSPSEDGDCPLSAYLLTLHLKKKHLASRFVMRWSTHFIVSLINYINN